MSNLDLHLTIVKHYYVTSMLSCYQLTDNEALKIAIKVTDAVHYMHSQDPIVIHQDLKPQNVLVSFKLPL